MIRLAELCPSSTCMYKIFKLTLNTLRERFDPGIHLNEFNVGENFIHLLDTFICGSYTFSPEIRSEPRGKHLKRKAKSEPSQTEDTSSLKCLPDKVCV